MMFFEIYDKHYQQVKRFIKITVKDEWAADDLTQETFLRVEKNMATLKNPKKLKPWIFRIAYNLCQDHFRNKIKFREKASLEETQEALVSIPKFEKILEQKQMGTCVQNQMDLLPESQRTVIELFDVEGFSQKEIAEILDITIENVKVRLHRARKNFKEILKDKCSFERDERDVFICVPKTKNGDKNK
jgi:RNA polymerase sigma-70 factor (ECF subfamily)